MGSVYRLRPLNDRTIEELKEPYLWFSKPSGFTGDVNDSNIRLMIDDNEIIKKAFSFVLNEDGINELNDRMEHIGVCCFTKTLPSNKTKDRFPNGKNSICIEYDKEKLSDYFLNKENMPDCFKEVIYHNEPITVESEDDYHFLYKTEANGLIYKSIYEMQRDPKKFMDELLFFLLTRISTKFKKQKELRIIWAGYRIKTNEEKGYHIGIPENCIKCIYIYPNTDDEFVDEIKKLGYDVKEMS